MKLGLVREDFSQHAETTFASLYSDKDLTDVTLVCEDGEEILAHRAILSCGSGFFKDLFKRHNQQQHPLVVLRFSRIIKTWLI